jgi:BirA family biotin operon repressor/biotin-[acetyl-CoA-carboxylase] ligase
LRKLATSLRIEAKRAFNRAELAARILQELDADYGRILQGRFQAIAEEWESRCTTIGQEVEISTGNRTVRGRAESLDAEGALLVRTEHGHLERIIGGDVTLRK